MANMKKATTGLNKALAAPGAAKRSATATAALERNAAKKKPVKKAASGSARYR